MIELYRRLPISVLKNYGKMAEKFSTFTGNVEQLPQRMRLVIGVHCCSTYNWHYPSCAHLVEIVVVGSSLLGPRQMIQDHDVQAFWLAFV